MRDHRCRCAPGDAQCAPCAREDGAVGVRAARLAAVLTHRLAEGSRGPIGDSDGVARQAFTSYLAERSATPFEVEWPNPDGSAGTRTVTLADFTSPADRGGLTRDAYSEMLAAARKIGRGRHGLDHATLEDLISGAILKMEEGGFFRKAQAEARSSVRRAVARLALSSPEERAEAVRRAIVGATEATLALVAKEVRHGAASESGVSDLLGDLAVPSEAAKFAGQHPLFKASGTRDAAGAVLAAAFERAVAAATDPGDPVLTAADWPALKRAVLDGVAHLVAAESPWPGVAALLTGVAAHLGAQDERARAAFLGDARDLRAFFNWGAYFSRAFQRLARNTHRSLRKRHEDQGELIMGQYARDDGDGERVHNVFEKVVRDVGVSEYRDFEKSFFQYLLRNKGERGRKAVMMLQAFLADEGAKKSAVAEDLGVSNASVTKYIKLVQEAFIEFSEQQGVLDPQSDAVRMMKRLRFSALLPLLGAAARRVRSGGGERYAGVSLQVVRLARVAAALGSRP